MTTIQNTRTWQVRPISADALAELRTADDAGNPPRLVTDSGGGSPLRCCLSSSAPGEQIALVSYAPLRRWTAETGADPGPYDELGPVFIHPRDCGGPAVCGFPVAYLGSCRMFRAYSADGSILGGRLTEAGELGSIEDAGRVLDEVFTDPRVAVVHARAVEFGCFTFEVRRS
ncbi:MAG TPA: DUF1203 domain-containing protein [Streptosporangiaceae bacterium]